MVSTIIQMYYAACFLFGFACLAAILAFVRIAMTAGETHRIIKETEGAASDHKEESALEKHTLVPSERTNHAFLNPSAIDHLLLKTGGRDHTG